jgi:hypothetical protein
VMAQVGESPSVGRPHIADALIKAGHVRDRQEAFDRFCRRWSCPRPLRSRWIVASSWCTRRAASSDRPSVGRAASTIPPRCWRPRP